jgi:hypothetical protein
MLVVMNHTFTVLLNGGINNAQSTSYAFTHAGWVGVTTYNDMHWNFES